MSQKSIPTILLVYPTIRPPRILEKNILNNFILDMREKYTHYLLMPEQFTETDYSDLKTILEGLMPDKPITNTHSRDVDVQVYIDLTINNQTYTDVDVDNMTAILNTIKSTPQTISFRPLPKYEIYSTTIVRAVILETVTSTEEDEILSALIPQCIHF